MSFFHAITRAQPKDTWRHELYNVWYNMLWRCLQSDCPQYKNYGGRGISVDPAWYSFHTFAKDMGPCPPNRTLDRIDNNGNYTKCNCRWATKYTQVYNTRRNSKAIPDYRDVDYRPESVDAILSTLEELI